MMEREGRLTQRCLQICDTRIADEKSTNKSRTDNQTHSSTSASTCVYLGRLALPQRDGE